MKAKDRTALPKRKPNNVRMSVRITKSDNKWYQVGDVHEVGCYITLAYVGYPSFEMSKGCYGITITDCEIIEILPPYKPRPRF